MINRRTFAVSAALAAGIKVSAAERPDAGKQFYELRRYLLDSPEKQQVMEAFFRDVEIPALNRAGVATVGVFKEAEGENATLYMLLPFSSLESFASLANRLAADAKYMADGAAVLDATKKNAPFLRIESSLLEAFDLFPRVVVPAKMEGRIYELRQYESPGFTAAQSKVEMFNAGGEIDIFHEAGLDPVFFGRSLAGEKLPNLTYMLSFEDMAAHDARWEAFKKHPEWIRIKDLPKYKGTVSNITRTFLKALPCSQI